MSRRLQSFTGLVLVLCLLSSASTAALPHGRHLLQYPQPHRDSAKDEEAAPDPYSSQLERTIAQQQGGEGGPYWDMFQSEDVQLVQAYEEAAVKDGRRVSVDAGKGSRQEVDMDSMTARSPFLKSLEDEEDKEEENRKAMMMAWNIFEQETIEKTTEPTAASEKETTEAARQQGTTPAAHPSYSLHNNVVQPWQSPNLDGSDSSEPEEKPHLATLVESQMDSYFPTTGDGSSQQSPEFAVLGQVQQSLAKALRQDIRGLYSLFGVKEDDVLDNVKSLYEDYSILKSDDPLAETNPTISITYKDDSDAKSSEDSVPEEKKPVDLKMFFAKYDLEVDADMMQEKILQIFHNAETHEAPQPESKDMAVGKKNKNDHAIHFHQSQSPKPSTSALTNKTCERKHDLSNIFQNLDLEVDADKMEENLRKYHDNLINKNNIQNVKMEPSTKGKASMDLKQFLSTFDLETDAEEVTTKLSDFHNNLVESRTVESSPDTFKPYFTETEKLAYDTESIEDFYTRFYSLKGTVIRAVPLVYMG